MARAFAGGEDYSVGRHHRTLTMTEQTTGLSQAEARLRQQTEGYNELPQARRQGFWLILRDVLREPMLVLLLAGGDKWSQPRDIALARSLRDGEGL
jgi:magnesium-transporting ATPase (P-type)